MPAVSSMSGLYSVVLLNWIDRPAGDSDMREKHKDESHMLSPAETNFRKAVSRDRLSLLQKVQKLERLERNVPNWMKQAILAWNVACFTALFLLPPSIFGIGESDLWIPFLRIVFFVSLWVLPICALKAMIHRIATKGDGRS